MTVPGAASGRRQSTAAITLRRVKKTSTDLDAALDHLVRSLADEGPSKVKFLGRGLDRLVTPSRRPRARGAGIITSAPTDVAANDERDLAETGFGA